MNLDDAKQCYLPDEDVLSWYCLLLLCTYTDWVFLNAKTKQRRQ
jgi:hypothetical protein